MQYTHSFGAAFLYTEQKPVKFPGMSRQQKIHEVVSPRNAKASLIDHDVARGTAYRQRARELIEAAWRTNDISRKKHLFDLAKTYERTADVMAPLPPAEPQIFRDTKIR